MVVATFMATFDIDLAISLEQFADHRIRILVVVVEVSQGIAKLTLKAGPVTL
jgi:hypothetical protein